MARVDRTRTRVDAPVDRRALASSLGLTGGKIPADFSGVFDDVPLVHRWGTRSELGLWSPRELGRFRIVVRRSLPLPGHKSAAHRTFVACGCGRLVPTGRLHQHICK